MSSDAPVLYSFARIAWDFGHCISKINRKENASDYRHTVANILACGGVTDKIREAKKVVVDHEHYPLIEQVETSSDIIFEWLLGAYEDDRSQSGEVHYE